MDKAVQPIGVRYVRGSGVYLFVPDGLIRLSSMK